ncbi:MAG: ABC transporter ATP-binding protein [Halobacteriaceae archaeon]
MAVNEAGGEAERIDEASESRIELRDIRKTYNQGEIVAAEDISLDVATDEFVVFLGPSGCGKTTTLRIISGLEQPDEGEVRIDGVDVTDHKPKDRDLTFVFQSIALFPHMTVRENIRFGLDMKTDLPSVEKNDRVDEVAEMLGIADLLDRKPSALSGGQQQRVSLGRAMVMEPAAFLLDEPFSALDAQLRDQMRTEVKRLQRQLETAMVFVTHDQEEAMTLGDKIVVMEDGRIQQVGDSYEIYNDPQNLFVATFIGSPSINTFESRVTGTGDGLTVETDLFEVSLTGERARTADVSEGEELTLAIRPENLVIDGGTSRFEAALELVEPHGDRDALYLSADGIDLAAIVGQGAVDASTERVPVDLERSHVWLFDADGERVA